MKKKEEKEEKSKQSINGYIPEPPTHGSADLQLKLDKDGNIILDESLLLLDASKEQFKDQQNKRKSHKKYHQFV